MKHLPRLSTTRSGSIVNGSKKSKPSASPVWLRSSYCSNVLSKTWQSCIMPVTLCVLVCSKWGILKDGPFEWKLANTLHPSTLPCGTIGAPSPLFGVCLLFAYCRKTGSESDKHYFSFQWCKKVLIALPSPFTGAMRNLETSVELCLTDLIYKKRPLSMSLGHDFRIFWVWFSFKNCVFSEYSILSIANFLINKI